MLREKHKDRQPEARVPTRWSGADWLVVATQVRQWDQPSCQPCWCVSSPARLPIEKCCGASSASLCWYLQWRLGLAETSPASPKCAARRTCHSPPNDAALRPLILLSRCEFLLVVALRLASGQRRRDDHGNSAELLAHTSFWISPLMELWP
jgi:hypothetical protein